MGAQTSFVFVDDSIGKTFALEGGLPNSFRLAHAPAGGSRRLVLRGGPEERICWSHNTSQSLSLRLHVSARPPGEEGIQRLLYNMYDNMFVIKAIEPMTARLLSECSTN